MFHVKQGERGKEKKNTMGKKNRNGTGLDALFGDISTPAEQDTGVTTVRLTLLEPNRGQPREEFNEEKLQELADSIKENGVLQPILVRPLENGGYQIVAGERRWRASRLAGLTEVPVYIKELTDQQTMQMALIENIQRQDLTPIEEASAYKNLMDTYGMTQQEVAQAVGKSRPAVANALRLLSLTEEVKKLLESGQISAGHARAVAGLPEDAQKELADRAAKEGWSVRELESAASAAASPRAEPEPEIRERSVKKDRPFLKEFELSVNKNSNIRVKAKNAPGGGVEVNLRIGQEQDMEEVLSQLAQLLSQY